MMIEILVVYIGLLLVVSAYLAFDYLHKGTKITWYRCCDHCSDNYFIEPCQGHMIPCNEPDCIEGKLVLK